MSLIQEALKRQQEEAKKGSTTAEPPVVQQPSGQEPPVARTSGLQVAPPMPPPSEEAPPVEGEGAKPSKFADKRVLGLVLKIVPIAAILIGGGFWIAKSMLSAKPPQVTAKPHAPSSSQAPAAPQQPAPAAPQTATTSQPHQVTSQLATNAQPKTESPPPAETQKPVEPVETQSESEASAPTVVEQVKTAPTPVPIVWPALTVTGVMGKGDKGAAKINNIIVDVGQDIDGVKLVSVGAQSVLLEYRGHQRTVKVGRSTQ